MTARIGVVGIGWWATFNHIPTVQASGDADIVAICDLDAERLRIAGDRFGIDARYTDLAEMLAAEKLDGVMVSTPHVAHTAPAIAALDASCHVLVEKPMATSAADGRAIAAAAGRASRCVGPGGCGAWPAACSAKSRHPPATARGSATRPETAPPR